MIGHLHGIAFATELMSGLAVIVTKPTMDLACNCPLQPRDRTCHASDDRMHAQVFS